MSKQSHIRHQNKNKHIKRPGYQKPHEDYRAGIAGDIVIYLLILGMCLIFIMPFYGLLPNPGNIVLISAFGAVIALFAVLVKRKKL